MGRACLCGKSGSLAGDLEVSNGMHSVSARFRCSEAARPKRLDRPNQARAVDAFAVERRADSVHETPTIRDIAGGRRQPIDP